jgi:hypothetical protein
MFHEKSIQYKMSCVYAVNIVIYFNGKNKFKSVVGICKTDVGARTLSKEICEAENERKKNGEIHDFCVYITAAEYDEYDSSIGNEDSAFAVYESDGMDHLK